MKKRRRRAGTDLQVPHVYDTGGATAQRVRRFANAPVDEQIVALSVLRHATADRVSNTLAIAALMVAVVFGMIGLLTAVQGVGHPFWPTVPWLPEDVTERLGWTAFYLAYAIFGALGARKLRLVMLRSATASALIAAYEAELTRRYAAKGREARAWQRTHSIQW